MKLSRLTVIAAGLVLTANAYAADLKVGFITSLSGPISALGIPYNKGAQAAMAYRSEVAGHKIVLIVLDDASDPATAARNARKLVNEDHVDVLIGTSGVPGALAIAAVARETKTPLISPTPVTVPADDGGFTVTTSQSFPLMVSTAVEKMKANGVKTVAYIGFSDALGDLAYDSLMKSTEAAGIKVVANERYARSDSSVTGQILKIVSLHPDAVFTGTSGTPGALPYLALAERGYKGGLYGTHGLVNAEFVRVGGTAVDGLMVPSGPVMVADQLPDSNPTKKVSLAFRKVYEKVQGAAPADAFSAYTFDALLLFDNAAERALKKVPEPGTPAFRLALRDAIDETQEFAGTHGVFTFKNGDPNGLDKRGAVMIRLDKGHWKLMP
ncbi:MAG: ABC transporter substrate-binding protein [Burkholderiaceae bacterium]